MNHTKTPARIVMFSGTACIAALGFLLGSAPPAGRVPPPVTGSTAIICNADEPGERLLIVGTILNLQRQPVAGATVTVYNTDASGLYNPPNSPTRVPRINGSVTSDENGRFQVLTVKPAAYPDNSEPAHIHLDVNSSGYGITYSAIWFEGDPLINETTLARVRRRSAEHPNEFTKVERAATKNGVLTVEHTIVLVEK